MPTAKWMRLLEEIRLAAEAGAFGVHEAQSRGRGAAEIQIQTRGVIVLAEGIERQKATEIAGIRFRRGDNKNCHCRDGLFPAGERHEIVGAIERKHGAIELLAEFRP